MEIFLSVLLFAAIIGWVWLAAVWAPRRFSDGNTDQRKTAIFVILVLAASGIGLGVFWDSLSALSYRIAHIRPMISQCRDDGDADACMELAQSYRQGVMGRCETQSRYGHRSSHSCRLLSPDPGKALQFAELACAAGNPDSCLAALPAETAPADRQSDLHDLCGLGAMGACDEFLRAQPKTKLAELLPGDLTTLCEAGNHSVCLYQMRDRLLAALSPEVADDLSRRMQLMTAAMQSAPVLFVDTPAQAEAAKQLVDAMDHTAITAAMTDPTGAKAGELRARLQAIRMPTLAEGAPR
ncbi:hypothetical protein [Paracoccus xiamenensis]|uniref:hypothetical protein n=1 Tax=Paracoccus xiamenensis TaxID=2714901 RepID=UPI0014086351|nr:hypothetical protein [Paracoccus xiamenensis]NHF73631.1 hypothetical protein [Paracoccus xiamenensis]